MLPNGKVGFLSFFCYCLILLKNNWIQKGKFCFVEGLVIWIISKLIPPPETNALFQVSNVSPLCIEVTIKEMRKSKIAMSETQIA